MADGGSWARKYRPMNLSEYLGASVKGVLETRFADEQHRPQVVLFEGPRGTGKTTAARLLAKDYLCLEPVNGHACGNCEMCHELDAKLIQTETGLEPEGVKEIDIAAEGQKQHIDDIISEALLAPMPPIKYKILILDEFHMANKAVQNRLLKVMEEPPKHLCMFLCTTNPESILGTILSRCQVRVKVHKADVEELAGRLLHICEKERVTTSMAALRQIARLNDRVPREAIMMLEQIALSNGLSVTMDAIAKATGSVANETYMGYFRAANGTLEDIIIFVDKLKKSDIAFKDFLNGLTRFVLDSTRIRYAIGLEDYSPEYVKSVKELFGMYNTEEMDCLLQIVEYANRMIAGDNNDTKEELAITTTAMRIGKVKLLNNGLTEEPIQASLENRRGTNLYSAQRKTELEGMNRSVHTGSADSMIASVFGKQTVMITQKPKLVEEPKLGIGLAEERQAADMSDEEFLALFASEDGE